MGPDPAVAATRLAVRAALTPGPPGPGAGAAGLAAGFPAPGDLVLAACSGGADSLALAAALAFEAPRLGLRAGGITVDHDLQPGSAQQAALVTRTLAGLGLDPVLSVRAEVARRGAADQESYPGPEAAARAGRYAALDAAAQRCGAAAILLGHTSDDEAEGVLLGLARGSGTRSLAGMAPRAGRYLRPLLTVSRAQTRAACAALALAPWQDPQNSDPAYTRVRVRHRVLPVLEDALGPGVPAALARTARALRVDADYLDSLAKAEAARLAGSGEALDAASVAALPEAIRSRVLRIAAIAAGSPPGALTARHVAGLDDLVTRWHGQRWADLPGGIRCRRQCGKLTFVVAAAEPGAAGCAKAADAGSDDRQEDADGRD